MNLTIQTLNGSKHDITLPDTSTVLQLKDKVSELVNAPTDSLKIIYKGKILMDNTKTLSQVENLIDGSMLVVMVSKTAPAKKPDEPKPVPKPEEPKVDTAAEEKKKKHDADPAPTPPPAPAPDVSGGFGNLMGGGLGNLMGGAGNPMQAAMQLMQQNPQLLMQLMMQDPSMQQLAQQNPQAVMQAMQQIMGGGLGNLMGGGGLGNLMGGGGAPATISIPLTPADVAAINEIAAMGFDKDSVTRYYLETGKNKELTLNFLLDDKLEGADEMPMDYEEEN